MKYNIEEIAKPKVSVCIPVYNGIKTIEFAISSVLKIQNITFELVIVDNNSTDGTFEFVNNASTFDSRIKCYRNSKNIGFPLNYFECLFKAEGQYVTFCGADDKIDEEGLNSMINLLDENVDLGILSGEILIQSDNNNQLKYLSNFGTGEFVVYKAGIDAITNWLLNSSISSIGGYVIRRKVINDCVFDVPDDTFYPMLYLARSICMKFSVANVPFVCLHQTFTTGLLQLANKQYLSLKSALNYLNIFDELLLMIRSNNSLDFELSRNKIDAQVADSLINNLVSYAAFGGYINGLKLIFLIYPRIKNSTNKLKFFIYSFLVLTIPAILLKRLLFIFRKNRYYLGKFLHIK